MIRKFHFLCIITSFANRLAVSLSKIFSRILILHLPCQTFFGRGEDGVIALNLCLPQENQDRIINIYGKADPVHWNSEQ